LTCLGQAGTESCGRMTTTDNDNLVCVHASLPRARGSFDFG
jgi:hypothetical protein